MPAKVYCLPEGFEDKVPDLIDCMERERDLKTGKHGDLYDAECESFKAELADFCREQGDDPMIGKVIHLGPVGDGYAEYMVWSVKPLSLLHLPLGDAWQMPDAHMRGLTLKEVREHVKSDENMRELFS